LFSFNRRLQLEGCPLRLLRYYRSIAICHFTESSCSIL